MCFAPFSVKSSTMCGLTGLYLTQPLLCLSITSSASDTNKYLYNKYLFVLVAEMALLLNKVPLFNTEISFYYTWFQDHQIKGSCGQDLYRALSALCVRRGARVRVVTEVKRELVKIHYFL